MNNSVHTAQALFHERAIDDRPDAFRERCRLEVETDDIGASLSKSAKECFTKMTAATGNQNSHMRTLDRKKMLRIIVSSCRTVTTVKRIVS